MAAIATVSTKTYRADLQADGTCLVSGIQAGAITDAHPATGKALDRQRALRADIQRKLYAAVPGTQDDPTAGAVIRWEANL